TVILCEKSRISVFPVTIVTVDDAQVPFAEAQRTAGREIFNTLYIANLGKSQHAGGRRTGCKSLKLPMPGNLLALRRFQVSNQLVQLLVRHTSVRKQGLGRVLEPILLAMKPLTYGFVYVSHANSPRRCFQSAARDR